MSSSRPPLALLLLLLVTSSSASFATSRGQDGGGGHCVWYGQCGLDPAAGASERHRKLNCAYDGPAREASGREVDVLVDACPHLARELSRHPADGSLRLCCDSAQLRDLKRGFAMAESLLGRCPACLANFRKNFCDLTCRPDQSNFVNVTKVVRGPTFDGKDKQ